MSRFPGNIIKLPNVTPTQSSAQGVWSLKDQLVYQRNNQWPFQRDPYFNYTTLLLQGNVPNTTGPQAMTQPLAYNSDASTNNFLVTPNGDVSPRPFSPYANTYGHYFNGSSYTSCTGFNFSTSDFTIEFFVNTDSLTAGPQPIGGYTSSGLNYTIALTTGGIWRYYLSSNGSSWDIASGVALGTATAGIWQHIAIVRSGSSIRGYFDGVGGTTVTSSAAIYNNSTAFYMGAAGSAGGNLTGYFSNVRVLLGTAAYNPASSTITVPTTPFATGTTNQVLLACQANRFIDSNTATTAKTITVNGTPRVTDNSPFVSTDFTTGAGYFDGGTDYLSIASTSTALPTGTQDYSVEAWFYWGTQTASFPQIITNPATDGFQIAYDVAAGTLSIGRYGVSPVVSYTVAQTALANQWTHVVATRSGNTHRLFINGVLRANGVNAVSFAALTTQTIGSAGAGNYFVGYMSDVRSVLGSIPTAYQTSSTTNGTTIFTPPATLLPAVSGTSLLTLQTRAASQNIGFIDSSPNEFIVTKNGNTTQGTFSPFSPTGWGNYFDGSDDSLTGPSGSPLQLGTGDFSIEAFVNGPTQKPYAGVLGGASTPSGWTLRLDNTGTLKLTNGTTSYSATSTVSANTWVHIAVTRQGTTLRFFINGTQYGSPTSSDSIDLTGGGFQIAKGFSVDGSNGCFTGYISNVRIIKSQAIYTGNFTPPDAALTISSVGTTGTNVASSITGTVSLLTCQSNRFRDASSNNFTITPNNGPLVQAFSPFAPATQSSPLVTGGSGYFDGTTDWLYTGAGLPSLGTSDFTIEMWIYPTTFASTTYPLFSTTNGSKSDVMALEINTSGSLVWYVTGTTTWSITSASVGTLTLNQWSHIAFTRSGTSFKAYINGKYIQGAATSSQSVAAFNGFNIGQNGLPGGYFTGYMSSIRYVIGSAVYTGDFTPPTAPPTAIPNTSLLLNFTGGGIVDATGRNVIETLGNAQIATSLTKWTGAGSISNNGASGTRLQVSSSSAPPQFNMGTGDYTVEFWINAGTPASQQCILDFRNADVAGQGYALTFNTSRQLTMYYNVGNRITTSAISANVWTHVAVVRYNGVYTIYLDGSSSGGTYNNSDAVAPPANRPLIGSVSDGSQVFNGNLSNFRISRMARYTSNFNTNLPTGPFPIG